LNNIPKLALAKKDNMRISLTFSCLFIYVAASAQKEITIDDFTTRDTFRQATVSGVNWMTDGKFYTSLTSNKVVKYDVTTGAQVEVLVDGSADGRTIDSYSFSKDERKLLVAFGSQPIYRRSFKADFSIYNLDTKTSSALSGGGSQQYATFSPDGNMVAFVRDNNLFTVDLRSGKEQQITTDGKPNAIINGSTDWVYEEELRLTQAFAWSPDNRRIAFYRFDETGVTEYNLQKWNKGALYPQDYRYKYPKAGEVNSEIEIWLYDVATGKKLRAGLGDETDIYLPRMSWTNDPNLLSVRRMNRLQNTIEILHISASDGKSTRVYTEKNDKYFDINYTDELVYLKNGRHFIVSSERSGYKHFYLYRMDGTLERPLTSGNFEATQLLSIDEDAGVLYFLSTEDNYLNRALYSITLDGKKKVRLSSVEGSRTVSMSPDARFYIDYVSTAESPLVVNLYQTKANRLLKVLESNEALKETVLAYGIVKKEFFQYTAGDGTTKVDGYLLKPAKMDAGRKYPVLVFQYSGPRSNMVSNSFGTGPNFYWHQMLVQKGIVVVVVDTRGTGSRGEAFTKQTYKELGKLELEDLLAAGKYLGEQDYIDKGRLAIWGWSYGGYTACLAMTKGAGTYKVGIAGAPVTSWRYYDNIYTERFLQRPQENPEGYDANSPLTHANKLQGKFLLIHGTGDDNVHVQNSLVLEEALINAGKQFRSHFYPDVAHGGWRPGFNHHRWTLMTEFLMDNL
jgi:dipeptidyl-peptidase-4